MKLRKRRGWIRWLGLAAVPFVVASSFLGLLVGVSGLCAGVDDMAHPDHAVTLCLFFCGAIAAPVVAIVPLFILLATLVERVGSPPFNVLAGIFRPPRLSPA